MKRVKKYQFQINVNLSNSIIFKNHQNIIYPLPKFAIFCNNFSGQIESYHLLIFEGRTFEGIHQLFLINRSMLSSDNRISSFIKIKQIERSTDFIETDMLHIIKITIFCVTIIFCHSIRLRHYISFDQLTDPVQPDFQIPTPNNPQPKQAAEQQVQTPEQMNNSTILTAQQQCERRCQPVINPDLCRANCNQARINSGLFFIAGALFVALFFGIGFCCALHHWQFRRQRSLRNLVVKYNQNTEQNLLSLQVFEKHRVRFMQMMKQTNKQQNLYRFFVDDVNNSFLEQIQQIRMKKEEPYMYKLQMQGKNPKGAWTAQGYFILHQIENIYVWFMRYYEDRQKAGQVGNHKHLIFEGKLKTDGDLNEFNPSHWYEYIGRWFYKDCEKDKNFSGKWKLMLSELGLKFSKQKRAVVSGPNGTIRVLN